ncbi:hypothetical protein [Nocardioides sp.]|uniref:hypothetical protein n=1 Tax=Nocardioides sp. TaxID=35761 RepID=UPI002D7F84D9|nr:hypothetical protein [Nocardioides sp.]
MDLKDRFDLATSGGPSHVPLGTRLELGRRAVRRRTARRAVGSLAAAATVVAGVATLATLATGQDRATEPAAPAVAAPAPTPTRATTVATSDDGWAEDEWARMDEQGNITLRRGVSVTDTLDPAVPGRQSVALDVTREGERRFVLLVLQNGGIISSSGADQPDGRSLEQFAQDEVSPFLGLPVALHRGGRGLGADLPLVGYDHGELYTVPGVTIVRVIEEPDIEDWCTKHETAAVEVRYKDETYFAVLGAGNCESSFTSPGVHGIPTLESAIANLRSAI